MEENDSIARANIVLNSPMNSISTLLGKVNSDTNLAAGAGSGGGGRYGSGGGWVARGSWMVNFDVG